MLIYIAVKVVLWIWKFDHVPTHLFTTGYQEPEHKELHKLAN